MSGSERCNAFAVNHPLHVQLHPTNKCNLHCVFCWIPAMKRAAHELPDKRWLSLTAEVCALEARRVTISGGGEPLIRSRLVLQMMKRFTSASIPGALVTNGTLITQKIAKGIIESGWQDVRITLHGSTAVLDSLIRSNQNAYKRTLRGIATLNLLKRSLGSQLPNLTICLVITRYNRGDLSNMLRVAKSHGVTGVCVRWVNDLESHSPLGLVVPEEDWPELYRAIQEAKGVARDYNLPLQFEFDPERFRPREQGGAAEGHVAGRQSEARGESIRLHCPVPFSELVIFANGMASPCCNFVQLQFFGAGCPEGILGDIKTKSLNAVWQNGFSAVRESMFSGELTETCRTCSPCMRGRAAQWPKSFWQVEFLRYKRRGDYQGGAEFSLKQLERYPTSALLHHHVGVCSLWLEKYEHAIHHLLRTVELDPGLEWAYLNLGKCYYLAKRYGEAETALRTNLDLTSNSLSRYHSWLFLAMVADARGDERGYDEALSALHTYANQLGNEDDVRQSGADPLVVLWVGEHWHEHFRLLRQRGSYNEGIRIGLDAITHHPDSAILHHYVGEFYIELGQYGSAVRHFLRARELNPEQERCLLDRLKHEGRLPGEVLNAFDSD